MRVLITGGAGLVGSHCAEYFAAKNAQVIVLDNLMRSKLLKIPHKSIEHNWRFLKKIKNVKCIEGDVRRELDVTRAIGNGVDVVIHAAGQPSVFSSGDILQEDFDINAGGTVNVLECLRRKSKKAVFIYCSTDKIYGYDKEKKTKMGNKKKYTVNDDTQVKFSGLSAYAASKLTGDIYTQLFGHNFKLRTAVFRMGCIYGPRQFGVELQGWVGWFVQAHLMGKKLTLYGDGSQVRDILYVNDLVMAFESFINSRFDHRVYNIGGGSSNSLSLNDCLSILEQETRRKPKVRFTPCRQNDQKICIMDIKRVSRELRWKPRVTPQAGIRKVIKWVDDNKVFFNEEKI
ncbi:MAG: NAD-dependent epimerase/dehydratase family protein [Candidatus Omnitrophica bacterium]|nr:NAD-dependent epimerase/dehydratase family protein [Candidatus Omnitrophota bacterium]